MRTEHTTWTAKRRGKAPGEAPAPSDAATPDRTAPFIRALAHETGARLRAVLGGGGPVVTPQALLGAAEGAQGAYEQHWRHVQSLHVVQPACRPGCAHCCRLTVEATGPEILLIAAHLRATRTPEQWEEIKGRVRRTAARVRGLTPAARARAAVPCALLEDELCTAHAARPLGCRSWNSRDAGACARALRGGGADLRPVQDQRPLGINAGVGRGLTDALRAAGLPEDPARPCELNTGLQIALDDPQALDRWLGGDDVFGPARAAVRYPE